MAHSKIYILIKNWVDVGHAVNTAGHASLLLYLRNKDNPDLQEWLQNSFRKVTCEVTDEQFEQAKQYEGWTPITEMAFDNQEIALAFLPRKEWPKFFKFLKLYGKIDKNAREVFCPSCNEYLGVEGQTL